MQWGSIFICQYFWCIPMGSQDVDVCVTQILKLDLGQSGFRFLGSWTHSGARSIFLPSPLLLGSKNFPIPMIEKPLLAGSAPVAVSNED